MSLLDCKCADRSGYESLNSSKLPDRGNSNHSSREKRQARNTGRRYETGTRNKQNGLGMDEKLYYFDKVCVRRHADEIFS